MKYTPLLALIMLCASCNFDNNPEEAPSLNLQAPSTTEDNANDVRIETESAAFADSTKYVDSFRIEMDSLLGADIKLPPIYLHDILNANQEATTKFTELAKSGRGKMKILVNAGVVAKELVHTINTVSIPQSDLLILIDKTYSMAKDIANVKASMMQIIDTVKKYKGTRLAVAVYGDKNNDGMSWFSFRNFETDYAKAIEYIQTIKVEGGGDWPESVYDAVMKCYEQDFWQSTKRRNIILIGDAPPLERPLSEYGIEDVLQKAREGNVKMNFYPIIIMPKVEEVQINPSELRKYAPLKLVTSLYPNPSKGHIDVGFEENGTYFMEVYNVAGDMIVSEEAYGISWGRDLGDVPNGMYILRVINKDHKFELIKFVVQR